MSSGERVPNAPSDPNVREGQRIGGYTIVRPLGAGAVGLVWEATRTADGACVAVKVLQGALADDPEWTSRFEREIAVLRTLAHPGIVRVLDAGRLDDGRPYFVMPRLEGVTLAAHVRASGGSLPPNEAWAIVRAVALALDEAHARGIVHRDLKPENVILVDGPHGERVPCVLDFGLARVEREPAMQKLTTTGAVRGTPAYMAPEQWWGHDVGPATDQYALGVMLFELLAGRLPFASEQYVALMQAHLDATPPALADVGATVPAGLQTVVRRSLEKRVSARFATLRDFVQAGDSESTPADTRMGASLARSPRATVAVVSAAALLAMVAVGYAGSHDPRHWAHVAGLGVFPTAAVALAVGFFVAFRRRPVALGWSLVPGILGTIGTYVGWRVVLGALRRIGVTEQFTVFNDGLSEANANRFVGLGLTSMLLLVHTTLMRGAVERTGVERQRAWILASGLGAAGVAAALVAAPAGAWIAAVGAVVVAWPVPGARSRREARDVDVPRVLAVVAALGAAHSHLSSRAGIAWALQPNRAARAAELVSASAESTTTWAVGGVTLAAVVAWAIVRRAAAPTASGEPRITRRAGMLYAVLGVWIVLDGALLWRVHAQRMELWEQLRPQFDLFGQLDPPRADDLRRPAIAPALRIGREVIALDAVGIARTQSVGLRGTYTSLVADLSHRLAATPNFESARVQLSIVVDSAVRWTHVQRVMRAAFDVGVRRAELLFTRGPRPRFAADAPPESRYALPADFGALGVELSASATDDDAPDAPFARVAERLLRAHGRDDYAVAVRVADAT